MIWFDLFLQELVQALATIAAFAIVFGLAWVLTRLGCCRRGAFRAALRVARRNREMGRRS